MKGTDKFLIGIIAGVALLVVTTFIVVLTQPKLEYRTDNSPESVVHNYLLALENGDYERALGCLSPALRHPPEDAEQFAEHIDRRCSWSFRDLDRDTSLVIENATVSGSNATVVVIQTIFSDGGVLSSSESQDEIEMTLQLQDGEWKLVSGNEYWCWCWNKDDGCR